MGSTSNDVETRWRFRETCDRTDADTSSNLSKNSALWKAEAA